MPKKLGSNGVESGLRNGAVICAVFPKAKEKYAAVPDYENQKTCYRFHFPRFKPTLKRMRGEG